MHPSATSVVVVGGGTAGWMAAALLAKILGSRIRVTLVESEAIGIVGVGEATIPPICAVNAMLGIDEGAFLRATGATIKLGIRFDGWGRPEESYHHSFGGAGRDLPFCGFHHFCTRARIEGLAANYWDYDFNALCIDAGRFAPDSETAPNPIWPLPHAYHFDSARYGQFLRGIAEARGVTRVEGRVVDVLRSPETGDVAAIVLDDGRRFDGALFLDCSGSRGLLIEQFLQTGYEDWSRWLPCDRALAVPSAREAVSPLYTCATARAAGWQWRIPLQHRNGNGLVYSSAHLADDAAAEMLMHGLTTPAQDTPRLIRFRTGRARRQWHHNVVAIGLSSGFLEPLESTSIYLIQSAIVRLLHLFQHGGDANALRAEYNRQSALEYERVRDFVILHYHAQHRTEPFWAERRATPLPDRLAEKIALFASSGTVVQDPFDIFTEASWVKVLLGQGILPAGYHPLAGGFSRDALARQFAQMAAVKREGVARLPLHDAWLDATMARAPA